MCVCVCVCIFIHLSVDGHFSYFRSLAIVKKKNAAMNLGVHVSFY